MEVSEGAYIVIQGKNKFQANKKGKGKIPPQEEIKKQSKFFFFCKK